MSSLAVGLLNRFGHRARRLPAVNLRTLRWLSVLFPASALAIIDFMRHFVFPYAFHDWPGFAIIWGGGLVASLAFSYLVFGIIEGMNRESIERNCELASLYAAAHHQAEQLKALREAGMALTAELSLDAVLQKVVDLSKDLVGASYGVLAVLDEERRIERLIASGLTCEEKGRIARFPRGLGIMSAVPNEGKPVRLSDICKHPFSVGFPAGHPEMKTLLGVPIISKGRLIGNLKLTNKRQGEEFTQEDEDKVVMLAAQAAIAIENARLYEREQALAVLTERERIAQDLHDGIIQDIYATGLFLEQCIEQVKPSSPNLADRLARSVEGLNDIIKDVRNYIFALQPTDLHDNDLTGGVENMAREFRINSLIDTELIVQGEIDGSLAYDQVGHMLQIAREGLTNVLKHARATAVTIRLSRGPDSLEFCIADNGAGFDLAKVSGHGHGLRNIAERAKILGGHFTIGSGIDRGAKLTVEVPIAPSKGERH